MASVFLSYDRDDSARARQFARALESAGHEVWWDLHVRGGAQFSKVIEEALKAADAIVVLWSRDSVESPWVRDEAAAGRDTNRLVPVTIDGTEPPLGFRQFQTIDLSRWRGRGKPAQLQTLLSDVASLGGDSAASPAQPGRLKAQQPLFGSVKAAGLAAVLLAVALALVLWRPWAASRHAVAAVVAADDSPRSQDYARDLLAKLGQMRSAQVDTLELVGPEARRNAQLVFEVSSSEDKAQVRANLVLLGASRQGLLWSRSFARPAAQAGDLREEVGYAAAQVLGCAVEAHRGGRAHMRDDVLKLYLNGCADLADPNVQSTADLIRLFRRVTEAAPDFPGGWARLLVAEDSAYADAEAEGAATEELRSQLRRDIKAARRLNPQMPEAYAAEVDLLPYSSFGERLAILDRGIALNPESAHLLTIRSGIRQAVGRVSDSLDDARKAVEVDPVSPQIRQWYIGTLAASGRTDAALKELEAAERLWPNSTGVSDARFAVHLRYGDPRLAWQSIVSGKTAAGWIGAKSFLDARANPTPQNVAAAIEKSRAVYRGDPSTLNNLVQVLSILGRDDELIPLLLNAPVGDAAFVSDVTFRPAAREFWHSPRSLEYAKRIGLISYWRSSGEWPDFCSDPDLPYDCREEAAKIA